MDKDLNQKSLSEDLSRMYSDVIENFAITDFEEFSEIDRSEDAIDDLVTLQAITAMMLYNIKDYSPDKIAKAKKLVLDFYNMANSIFDEYENEGSEDKEKSDGVFSKVRFIIDSFKSKFSKKEKGLSVIEDSLGLMILKDVNGNYRWFARYSNNYRDEDYPPEIISKQSHNRFVDMVDSGKVPMPELWHWHVPGTKWGEADWVAFDEDTGVAMAAGHVLPGHEKEAELLASYGKPIAVSHGMPSTSIRRDSSDNSIIVEHITREISDLPLSAAANKLTSFSVMNKETDMTIPKNKKEYLKSLGFSDALISEIESGNSEIAKSANDAELESKEANEEEKDESAPIENKEEGASSEDVNSPADKESATEEEKSPDADEEKEADGKEDSTEDVKDAPITKEEIVEAITHVMKQFEVKLNELSDKVDLLENQTKEYGEKESYNQDVPSASLAAMIAKQFSSIGSEANSVRKNSQLLKNSPSETPAEDEQNNLVNTGNPVVDNIISGVIGRK